MSDTNFDTFRSAELSLFQSALAEVLAGPEAPPPGTGPAAAKTPGLGIGVAGGPAKPARPKRTPEETASHDLMRAFTAAAAATTDDDERPREVDARPGPAIGAASKGVGAAPGLALGGRAAECAAMALSLARAIERGDKAEEQRIRSNMATGSCDPRFIETITIYLQFRAGFGKIPYRRHKSLNDFVLPLADKVRIAVVGDWATGMEPARLLLESVAAKKPDVVLHVGDVYYSCTPREARERFLGVFDSVFGDRRKKGTVKVFTLSGNHDMYSGGAGYYGLLDVLGQPASYFCLRNKKWQVLGMDTGLHDGNPLPTGTHITRLERSERDWHVDKIKTANGRKTIVTSHHQLFTIEKPLGKTPGGGDSGLNTKLYAQLREVLPQISLWLWGHEHNFIAYDPFPTGGGRNPLSRGRCLGASGVPVRNSEKVYDVDPRLKEAPSMRPVRLSKGRDCYAHAYSIIDLDGPTGTAEYFEVPHEGGPTKSLFKETL